MVLIDNGRTNSGGLRGVDVLLVSLCGGREIGLNESVAGSSAGAGQGAKTSASVGILAPTTTM